MFDIDQTLITQLDPYYHAHRMNNSHLNQRLIAQPKHISEKFNAYQFISNPYALMDEKIPSLLKRLQERYQTSSMISGWRQLWLPIYP